MSSHLESSPFPDFDLPEGNRPVYAFFGTKEDPEVPSALPSDLTDLNVYHNTDAVIAVIELLKKGSFPRLTAISFRDVTLPTFPEVILNIPSLTFLSLVGNGITNVPPEITRLTNLEILFLRQNSLSEMPDLRPLTHLKYLDITDNDLVALPPLPPHLETLFSGQ